MGNVNNSFGYDSIRTQKLGKYYNTIDFEVNSNFNATEFQKDTNKPIVGTFEIGGNRYPVTFSELNAIEQTMKDAKDVVNKGYALGITGR
jgi:hypothetical protein